MTEVTSHSEMSWLNASAPKNIFDISVTELVSHPVMFPLNLNRVSSLNAESIEVTSEVFQSLIGPNIESEQIPSTGASKRQSITAFLKSLFITSSRETV